MQMCSSWLSLDRVSLCLSEKTPVFWYMRTLGGPGVTPVSELLTVIIGNLGIEERLLHGGDSKPGASVKSSLDFSQTALLYNPLLINFCGYF